MKYEKITYFINNASVALCVLAEGDGKQKCVPSHWKHGEWGVKGNWGKVTGVTPNSDLKLNQVGSTEEYCITLTSTDQPLIYFAFQVDGNPIKILKPN